MTDYRKKPVVIQASQWFKLGDHPAVTTAAPDHPDATDKGWIDTLEGGHYVTPGDWIITGVKGEHYPCKPDIFAMTYEPVPAQPAGSGGVAKSAEWLESAGDDVQPWLTDFEWAGVNALCEESKDDRCHIVGSQVRWLVMLLRRQRDGIARITAAAPASPQGWPADATYIADVMPDWTTMQLPDGSSFAFKRENGMVYKLPHPDAPFIPLPPPPSSGDGRGVDRG